MKNHTEKIKPRNPLHNHPLMKKGGVHDKTNKAKRKKLKQRLKKEWCYSVSLILVPSNNTIH